jgi:hypothetical protein
MLRPAGTPWVWGGVFAQATARATWPGLGTLTDMGFHWVVAAQSMSHASGNVEQAMEHLFGIEDTAAIVTQWEVWHAATCSPPPLSTVRPAAPPPPHTHTHTHTRKHANPNTAPLCTPAPPPPPYTHRFPSHSPPTPLKPIHTPHHRICCAVCVCCRLQGRVRDHAAAKATYSALLAAYNEAKAKFDAEAAGSPPGPDALLDGGGGAGAGSGAGAAGACASPPIEGGGVVVPSRDT